MKSLTRDEVSLLYEAGWRVWWEAEDEFFIPFHHAKPKSVAELKQVAEELGRKKQAGINIKHIASPYDLIDETRLPPLSENEKQKLTDSGWEFISYNQMRLGDCTATGLKEIRYCLTHIDCIKETPIWQMNR